MSYSSFELLNHRQPILVFGRDGQVGRALHSCLKDTEVPAVFLGRADCDLANESSLVKVLNRYQPQVILNAAAYTAVDKAETEPNLAYAVNAKAPELMARYIANIAHGIFVHYSTDYVFADTKQDAYLETDPVGPMGHLNIYGRSKLAAEQAIEEVFDLIHDSGQKSHANKSAKYFILRTSWVYGDGNNFIRAILRLARGDDQLKVVTDQIGVPTSAQWLAKIGLQIADSRVKSGIYHVVPDGETSWHDLAAFVIKTLASYDKGFKIASKKILPISANDYLVTARRPYNSRLNNAKLKRALSQIAFTGPYPCWQDEVIAYIKDCINHS